MIRPEQKLSLLSSTGEVVSDPNKNISVMTILRDIMKEQPECTEELAQAINEVMADTVYRSISKGEILVMFDTFTFIPSHLDLGPEDFPPDDKTLHVRVDLVRPDIPGVDPACLVIPDPQERPM
jgi:hypothetical protein